MVIKKIKHNTSFAVISQADMDAIKAVEAQAELAQRKAAPAASTKASGARAQPPTQELFNEKHEN